MSKIPKLIHLSWKDKDIIESDSLLIKHGVKRLIDLNPDWQYKIHTDEEVSEYLVQAMGSNYDLVKDVGIVAKTDIWRLYKLYYEGGMYVDIDRFCDVKLSEVIPDNVTYVLPICREYDFSHDIMISSPGNQVFANAIEMYLHRRKLGFSSVYFLGAQTYMHAITYSMFGKMFNTNPGVGVFNEIINNISQLKDILVYKEDPPYSTFLYRNKEDLGDWVELKKQLYKDNNITHWTGEW